MSPLVPPPSILARARAVSTSGALSVSVASLPPASNDGDNGLVLPAGWNHYINPTDKRACYRNAYTGEIRMDPPEVGRRRWGG